MCELFPKWSFKEDKDYIYIRFDDIDRKFYKQFICLDKITNVYNSIDYIINFLELNNFSTIYKKCKYTLCEYYNKKLNIYVYIYVDNYMYIIDKIYYDCDSEMMLYKLKEILEVESQIKSISNH